MYSKQAFGKLKDTHYPEKKTYNEWYNERHGSVHNLINYGYTFTNKFKYCG
jgi:hypothetical protein